MLRMDDAVATAAAPPGFSIASPPPPVVVKSVPASVITVPAAASSTSTTGCTPWDSHNNNNNNSNVTPSRNLVTAAAVGDNRADRNIYNAIQDGGDEDDRNIKRTHHPLFPPSSSSKDDFFLHHYPQNNDEPEDNRNVNRSYHGTTTFTIGGGGGIDDAMTTTERQQVLLLQEDKALAYPNFFLDDLHNTDAIIGTQLLESMNFQTTSGSSTGSTHNQTTNNSPTNKNDESKGLSPPLPQPTPPPHHAAAPVIRSVDRTNGHVVLESLLSTTTTTTNNTTNHQPGEDSLSYHRMKRHLANRLIGTTGTVTTVATATTGTTGTANVPATTSGPTPTISTAKLAHASHSNNNNNTGHFVDAALTSPSSSSALKSPSSTNVVPQHQQETVPSSSFKYDPNNSTIAMLQSDTFYHHISSNESAISAPSKIMHPHGDDTNSVSSHNNNNHHHNDATTNPRLFTTWSSFGAVPTTSTSPSSTHPHTIEPRSTTPVQLYAGQQSAIGQPRRSLPRTKDIGMNVMEPNVNDDDDEAASANLIQSHRFHTTANTTASTNLYNDNNNNNNNNNNNSIPMDGTIASDTTNTSGTMNRSSLLELERGLQNLWSPDVREFQPNPPIQDIPNMTLLPSNHHHHNNNNSNSNNGSSFGNHNHDPNHLQQQPALDASSFYTNQHHAAPLPTTPFSHSPSSNYNVATTNSNHSYGNGSGGGPPSGNSSISDPVTTYSSGELTSHQVEIDLQPYCWDSTLSSKFGVSRTLVLMHVSQHYIRIADVRTACETFGVLESFRADFVTKFGIYFISYYDIRSAQYASVELQSILQRISVMSRSNEEVVVQFCLSLNSASPYDETQIVINNLPTTHHMNESTIMSMLSSYGAVRTMQFLNNNGSSNNGSTSCLVEFQNIQDTKQALLELDNSQPFIVTGGMLSSNNVITVQVKPRDENERRLGRDLLALLSRWRHSNNQSSGIGLQQQQMHYRGIAPNATSAVPQHPSQSPYHMANANGNSTNLSNIGPSTYKFNQSGMAVGDGVTYGSAVGGRNINTIMHPQQSSGVTTTADPWFRDSGVSGITSTHMNDPVLAGQQQSVPQYVLGPDGRFTPSHVPKSANNTQYDFGSSTNHNMMDRHQQQYHLQQRLNGGQMYPPHPQPSINHQSVNNRYGHDRSFSPHQQSTPQQQNLSFNNDRGRNHHQDTRSMGSHNTPYYAHTITPTDSNSVLGRSLRSGSGHSHMTPGGQSHGTSVGNASGMDNNLTMDLDLVEIGQDTRTSLMVRNIPNKYTQQMLLSEFDSNGHGPGIIDFFYLPIDFKNRCNRGYAFINFVNYKDILGFHRRYFGKHWRTFNSDKICDITYARIQGKDAMLKRFENSALMEKDDEYKPLVFASDGPNRGTRLPFPDPMNLQPMNHQQQQHGSSSSSHHLHLQPQPHRHQSNHRHTNTIFNTSSSTASMDSRTEM